VGKTEVPVRDFPESCVDRRGCHFHGGFREQGFLKVSGPSTKLCLHCIPFREFGSLRLARFWSGIADKAPSAVFGRDQATTNVEQEPSIESLLAFRTGVELSVPESPPYLPAFAGLAFRRMCSSKPMGSKQH